MTVSSRPRSVDMKPGTVLRWTRFEFIAVLKSREDDWWRCWQAAQAVSDATIDAPDSRWEIVSVPDDQPSALDVALDALRQIAELHSDWDETGFCHCTYESPCPTRRLANDAIAKATS